MTVLPKRIFTIEVDEAVAARVEASGLTVPEFIARQLGRFEPRDDVGATARQWAEDNKKALDDYRQFTEQYGFWSDEHRTF